MRFTRGRAGMAALVVLAMGLMVSAAWAGVIRYTIVPSDQFTIHDNGNGIVKVAYNGCVTAGVRQTIRFTMVVNVTNKDANATFKVLREEGQEPESTFDPATVFLAKGAQQSFDVTYSFTLPSANDGRTTFRLKLDPDSGEGLGEGAGVMVTIPCVLAAPPPPPPGQEGGQNVDASGPLAAPTQGVLPSVESSQAAGDAPCIARPRRFRARAGKRQGLRVRVFTSGQPIANSLVRVVYPGGTRIGRTNVKGIARFRIRPTQTGRVTIQSDVCFGARRFQVRAAQVAPARPRYTG